MALRPSSPSLGLPARALCGAQAAALGARLVDENGPEGLADTKIIALTASKFMPAAPAGPGGAVSLLGPGCRGSRTGA